MLQGLADWLFNPSGLTPHGFCLLWQPGLIWTHALSDTGIGLAYFTIPILLAIVARQRRDLVFKPLFWLFATFILLCGTGHWLELLTLWVPLYGLQGAVKAATAIVSIVTAIALWRLMPLALALPSPAQFRVADAALRDSEARYRASFEHSPIPLHTLDAEGVITGVSNSWLTLFGYQRCEIIGRKLQDFCVTEPDAPQVCARLVTEPELHELEQRFRRQDGSVIDTLVSARQERRNEALWIMCVVVDITARRQIEAALSASEDRLRQAQKMEAVGQLTGGIAHDFNNMLQGIGGSLDLMQRRLEQNRPEEVPRYVQAARQSLDRAAGLTHRMLAFARRQTLQPKPLDPDRLVRGMAELVARTVGPAVKVEMSLNDGVWLTRCDANQLENALLNLAINSRDAMLPDGGKLIITTADRVLNAADLADQTSCQPGGYVEIAVRDTGTGIAPDLIEHVFEPFFTTKPTGQGTGLGLSQVYGFVQQSGGFVRIASTEGQGTTVRLFLPRMAETEAAALAPDGQAPAEHADDIAAGKVVMVVDDEPGVRALIAESLRDMGCVVLQAADGRSGLAVLQASRRVDLLITDVGLPGLNGRQLADAARAERPGLRVILITGFAGTALDRGGLERGMEVMPKPFTLEALETRIQKVFQEENEGLCPHA